MPLRDDHEAALARADALEVELERERAKEAEQSERVARLEAEIAESRAKLARVENELGRIKPAAPRPRVQTPAAPQASPSGGAALAIGIVVAFGALLALVVSIGKSSSDDEAPASAPPPPNPSPPFVADGLLTEGRRLVGSDRVQQIAVDYVSPDGKLDPTYGEITIETTRPPPPKPPDDPSRPTGAPSHDESMAMADLMMARCPRPHWSPRDGWRAGEGPCFAMGPTPGDGPNCTIAQVLERAHTDGAPAALARITADWTIAAARGEIRYAWQWKFSISDPDRGIDFDRSYPDCSPGR